MIDGVTISQGVRFLDILNKDISRLITTTDDQMQAIEYASLLGNACYFKPSQSATKPIAWVPHAFSRMYVPEGDDFQTYSSFAFLNIYLTPKHHDEPLAHWGVGKRKVGKDLWAVWEPMLLRPDGPGFLQKKDIEPFETSHVFSEVLEDFRHAVKPLIELHSEDQLERFVLGPIRKALSSLSESAKLSPKPRSR